MEQLGTLDRARRFDFGFFVDNLFILYFFDQINIFYTLLLLSVDTVDIVEISEKSSDTKHSKLSEGNHCKKPVLITLELIPHLKVENPLAHTTVDHWWQGGRI